MSVKPCIVICILPDAGAISTSAEFLYDKLYSLFRGACYLGTILFILQFTVFTFLDCDLGACAAINCSIHVRRGLLILELIQKLVYVWVVFRNDRLKRQCHRSNKLLTQVVNTLTQVVNTTVDLLKA